jgi:hypothetical protein
MRRMGRDGRRCPHSFGSPRSAYVGLILFGSALAALRLGISLGENECTPFRERASAELQRWERLRGGSRRLMTSRISSFEQAVWPRRLLSKSVKLASANGKQTEVISVRHAIRGWPFQRQSM